jgi:hypothetical protein
MRESLLGSALATAGADKLRHLRLHLLADPEQALACGSRS